MKKLHVLKITVGLLLALIILSCLTIKIFRQQPGDFGFGFVDW
jgi:hypothetical protein